MGSGGRSEFQSSKEINFLRNYLGRAASGEGSPLLRLVEVEVKVEVEVQIVVEIVRVEAVGHRMVVASGERRAHSE